MIIDSVKHKLQDIIGRGQSDTAIDCIVAGHDSSPLEGKTPLVIWPSDAEQLRKVIRLATLRGYQLTLRGAGCGSAGACIPNESIVIDLSYFNRIIELDRNEQTIIVQSGTIVQTLNDTLQKVGLEFPMAPWDSAVCTVGGMIATNARNTMSHKFSSMGEWIQWIEVIDASGKEFRTENVTNFIGKEGATGAMVRIKLKLIKKIGETSSTTYQFLNADAMLQKLQDLSKDSSILALEYIDKHMAKYSNRKDMHHLLVKHIGTVGRITDREEKELWQQYYALVPHMQAHKLQEIQVAIPAHNLADHLRFTRRERIPTTGSISINNLSIFVKQTYPLSQYFTQVGSTITGGIGQLHKEHALKHRQELKILKRNFDPSNIMNMANI